MASQTVGAYWLPSRLAKFHTRYPGLGLDVRIGNTEAVGDAVEAGRVELGVVEGAVDRPALSSRMIATDEMILVVSPTHPWAKGTSPEKPILKTRHGFFANPDREHGSPSRR